MEEFLNALKEYELLLELILTAASLFISVFVVFQTKNLAKRQAKQNIEIAERQAKQEREIADRQNQLQKWQVKQEREIAEQQNELQKWQVKQEREIAEQQNELQKRQIRLELFERNWQINNALSQIFSFASNCIFLYEKYKDDSSCYEKMTEWIMNQKKELNVNELEMLINQSRHIISREKYKNVALVKIHFRLIDYEIQDLKTCNYYENEGAIKEIYGICKDIMDFDKTVTDIFREELNVAENDK